MKKFQFKTAIFIALRYLFSKKKHNMVNIISIISSVGIMAGTAALIIVLSVFNGMEKLITGSVNSFNPDFQISLKEGKSFSIDSALVKQISEIEEVVAVHEVVSDMVLLNYGDRQSLVRLKGVSTDYPKVLQLDSLLIDGDFRLQTNQIDYAVLGAVAAGVLQVNLNSSQMMKCYYPRRTKKNLINPTEAFNTRFLVPSGVFASYSHYDEEFLFCSIEFARNLMEYDGEVTSLEVKLVDKANVTRVKNKIAQFTGPNFQVKDQYEQEEMLFKTIKNEKLVVFLILSFILLMAAFNIVGTLGMLIIEKKEDVEVLKLLGASDKFIYRIFVMEGMFVSFVGGILGMLLGFIVCFIQQTFHVIKIGGGTGNYIINYYPVQMSGMDFLIVLLTVVIISYLASRLPSGKVTRLISAK